METSGVAFALSLGLALGVCGDLRSAEPQSIQSFVALKEKWPSFAMARLLFRVEGRYAFLTRKAIRFENCDLQFAPAAGTELPRLAGQSRTAEVAGRLVQGDDGKIEFVVEELRERPSDLEVVRARRAEIVRRGEAEPWYRLGEWVAGRAEFYRDDELRREADAANVEGLQIERNDLPPGDISARFDLARKAADLKAPQSFRVELLHEGYRLKWEELQEQKTPDRRALLDELARDLPGALEPLSGTAAALDKKYAEIPIAAYATADEKQRKRLHRLFYAEVALEMILAGARADGSNGAEIAGRIEKLLPERTALAEQQRDAQRDWRLKGVASLTRADMLALANEFDSRGQPEKALQAKQSWVEARLRRLRAEGAPGLVRAAADYQDVLGDRATAARLLLEAHELAPGSTEVAASLQRAGYVWSEGKWLPADAAAAIPMSEIEQAIRAGRVTRGMAAQEVRKVLGAPESVIRLATAGRISDVWIYGPRNSSRLAIHLLRLPHEPSIEAKVIEISQVQR
jgi:hypothetical protein